MFQRIAHISKTSFQSHLPIMIDADASSGSTMDNTTGTVPYSVSDLGNFRAKALFTVPSKMAHRLILHPILCCGSEFILAIDDITTTTTSAAAATTTTTNDDDDDGADNAGEVAFLSCEFESADPTSTALELSKRLSHRVGGDPSNAPEAGLMLGLLGK